MFGVCLECDELVELEEDVEIGDVIPCPRCSTRMEVLDLHPVVLDYP